MSKRWRGFLFGLYLVVLALLGIRFAPALRANLIDPAAAAIWLALRLFILSIDQKYFWAAAILLGAFWGLHRLSQELENGEIDAQAAPANAALQKAEIWRGDIQFGAGTLADRNTIRHELTRLLVSMHSSKQQGNTYADTLEALRLRQIPLPEGAYTFLFADPRSNQPGSRLQKAVQSIRQAPRHWIDQWTGRSAASYYREIDELLAYLENSLEMHHDERTSDPSKH